MLVKDRGWEFGFNRNHLKINITLFVLIFLEMAILCILVDILLPINKKFPRLKACVMPPVRPVDNLALGAWQRAAIVAHYFGLL
jgi:hypothetical protein